MHALILELTMLGLPMHALLLSVRTRLVPAVAFGVELVVHIPFSEKQLSSMQASWIKKLVALWCLGSFCFGGLDSNTVCLRWRWQSCFVDGPGQIPVTPVKMTFHVR